MEEARQKLTQGERNGRCPDCNGRLLAGPRGGYVKCSACNHEFNVFFLLI